MLLFGATETFSEIHLEIFLIFFKVCCLIHLEIDT